MLSDSEAQKMQEFAEWAVLPSGMPGPVIIALARMIGSLLEDRKQLLRLRKLPEPKPKPKPKQHQPKRSVFVPYVPLPQESEFVLLSETEAAARLKCTVAELRQMRWENRGPTYTYLDRRARYKLHSVDEYLKAEHNKKVITEGEVNG